MSGGWPYLTPGRAIALCAVLLLLGYLLFQTRTPPVLSNWSGGQVVPLSANSGVVNPPAAAGSLTGRGLPSGVSPSSNPLGAAAVVQTQGYGVGSHAPADVWGGLDLAIDGNNDGQADPEGTMGAPVYATISGVARVKPDTWPAGNYLSIENDSFKVAYAHLSRYAVADGDTVAVGQIVAYVGATGQASGPHLHYEVWDHGKNVDPTGYGALAQSH